MAEDFFVSLVVASLRLCAPLLLATLGEIINQRAGVMNMGVEGTMAIGAFVAFAVTFFTGNVLIGILASVLVGVLFGLLHGYVSISLRVNQAISGMAITILGLALGGLLYRGIFGVQTSPPQIPDYIHLNIPALSNIPVIGRIIFGQNFFFFFAIIMVPVMGILLFRTTIGLKIRTVGEDPRAAETLGINVFLIRYSCVIIGSILSAMAGASLTLDVLTFREYIISGRGWIAVTLVVFARWNPYLALGGSVLFGFADALQLRLQTLSLGISPYFFVMMPYLFTLIALVVSFLGKGGSRMRPASLAKPYKKGEG